MKSASSFDKIGRLISELREGCDDEPNLMRGGVESIEHYVNILK